MIETHISKIHAEEKFVIGPVTMTNNCAEGQQALNNTSLGEREGRSIRGPHCVSQDICISRPLKPPGESLVGLHSGLAI